MDRRTEILQVIVSHLQGRGIQTEGVDEATDLVDELGLDSLDTVELTLGLEEAFGVEIPDSDLEDVRTVGDVIDLIEKKTSVGA
jgi:acyl carrier protein